MTRTILGLLLTIALLLSLPRHASAQAKPSSDEASVRQFLSDFIAAFDNLDWEKFRASFEDDATVFFPRGRPDRASGRAEVEEHFKNVFEQIRAGRTQGPYMDLRPRGLRVAILGEVAVVTFHLDDRPGFINRRTLVLRKTPRGWKIAHLHASEVAI
jgi:uncharacterized protein (TIGR02246 family)